MKAIVLAAGQGLRMRPLTDFTPKCMLPICGRPLIERILLWLARHNITQIALNLNYRPNVITNHLRDGSDLGVNLIYSHEKRLLGTAGALKKLEEFWDGPFAVIYGDVLTDMNLSTLIDFHFATRDSKLTLAAHKIQDRVDVGLLDLDTHRRVVQFKEKPKTNDKSMNLVNSGVMVLDPDILQFVPESRSFDIGLDLLPQLLESDVPIYGWPLPRHNLIIDIGSPKRYALAQEIWKQRFNGRDP